MGARRTPKLILLNGAPGIGKSTLARLYIGDHPLAFCLDLDGIRRLIGDWEQQQEAPGLLARDMAVAMVRTHLTAGYDVVVPQYVARTEFIESLAAIAEVAHASFYEAYLTDDKAAALARFDARKLDPVWVEHHAEAARVIGGHDGLAAMFDRIEALRMIRPSALTIHTTAGNVAAAYLDLTRALAAESRE